MNKKLLLIGPLSKNACGGVSLGFESLVEGAKSAGYPIKVVDTLWGGEQKVNGRFTIRRSVASLVIVLNTWIGFLSAGKVYMTISSSTPGFIKDCLVIWPAWLLRKRIVCHLKGGGYGVFYEGCPPLLQWGIRTTLNRVTKIVVLGELLRAQFDFVDNPDERLVVVPNGLTVGLAEREQNKNLPEEGKPIRILYLSNLIPSKGFLDLLESCKLLSDQGLNFRCDFCGSFVQTIEDGHGKPWTEERFKQRIEELGLAGVVTYHGNVRGKPKADFLESAHCLVLPTAYLWEGQPISIIEALAYATPVISTAHRGIPEEVEDGFNGFLVPFGAPQAIADAMNRLTADNEVFSRFSRNALERFRQTFTREKHLASLLSVIADDPSESILGRLSEKNDSNESSSRVT